MRLFALVALHELRWGKTVHAVWGKTVHVVWGKTVHAPVKLVSLMSG